MVDLPVSGCIDLAVSIGLWLGVDGSMHAAELSRSSPQASLFSVSVTGAGPGQVALGRNPFRGEDHRVCELPRPKDWEQDGRSASPTSNQRRKGCCPSRFACTSSSVTHTLCCVRELLQDVGGGTAKVHGSLGGPCFDFKCVE